ncbi:hypothetical protein EON80_22015, partial [bacterium]
FYQASSLTAISAAIPVRAAVTLRTNRSEPGRVKVQLRDSKGRPVIGSVHMTSGFSRTEYSASVPPQGAAFFSDLPKGEYALSAWSNQIPMPPLFGTADEPFPSDAELTGVRQFVVQGVKVTSGQESLATMQPQLQSYIRGRIKVPDGTNNYKLYTAHYTPPSVQIRYNPGTGEYLAGPFDRKDVGLQVMSANAQPSDPAFRQQNFTFDLVPGKVVHADLEPGLGDSTKPRDEVRTLLSKGIFNAPGETVPAARVLLPNGKTPAWGAIAKVYTPETWRAFAVGRANSLGNLSPIWGENFTEIPVNPPPGSPTEAVLVVSLPGAYGATIVPLQRAASANIVLPPAASVKGRVTVGGQPLSGLPSNFRVLAAYQGQGKLNATLSVDMTPDSDGNFELNGLTPGTYLVQAARDGIWLSTTKTLTVGNTPIPDLNFEIAPPGGATLMHFQNAKGEPVVGRSVVIERPSGPLTEAYWPKTLTTDSRGDLYLNGLEAGEHRLKVEGLGDKNGAIFTLNVPALQADVPVQKKSFVVRP